MDNNWNHENYPLLSFLKKSSKNENNIFLFPFYDYHVIK